jgi:hypothetical protein
MSEGRDWGRGFRSVCNGQAVARFNLMKILLEIESVESQKREAQG